MDTIRYAILRTVSEQAVEGAMPGYAGGVVKTNIDEMALFVGEYENENVIATGTVDYVNDTWTCSDSSWDELLHSLPLLDRAIPRSFLIESDAQGRITAYQGPVTLALLDIKNKRNEAYDLVAGEVPTDIALTDGFWFTDNALTLRPENPTTISGNGTTITLGDLPAGSQIFVIVDGQMIEVPDTTIQVDEPGQYGVHIVSPWPMREARYDVQVEQG